MAIEAITFDFWNTLFRNGNGEARTARRAEAVASVCEVDEGQAREALRAAGREHSRLHREENRALTTREAIGVICADLGRTLSEPKIDKLEAALAEAILKHPAVPIEGALDAVRTAATRYPVGLISDTGVSPGRCLTMLLRRNGFLDHMQSLIYSDEAGACKPHRIVFEKAASQLGVTPSGLYHVGDLEYSDIAGAKAVGAKAGLFTGENRAYRDGTRADDVYDSWDAFVERFTAAA
jgi:putative hydrolase of the HAD superfamily